MANTSQTYSTETSIQNDFKIFLGKKSEIVEILANGRVVDKKWYLAWDTGEIFIGNKLHKLMKFGGSNEDLSADDVKSLIETETHGSFNKIRKQVAKVLQDYYALSTEQRKLAFEFSSTLAGLTTNIRETIQDKISEVLSDYSNITYSKSDIDSKINNAVINIKNLLTSNYVEKSYLEDNKYTTEDYVNSKFNTSLIYATGNEVKTKLTNRVTGMFFTTSRSDDGTFEKAHIYYLINGQSEDMTPAGSGGGGGGGTYIAPTLELTFNDSGTQVTSKLIELGSSFNGTRTFAWTCSAPAQISGTMEFWGPKYNTPSNEYRVLKTNINPLSPNKTIALTNELDGGLMNPAAGEYAYTIKGTDKQGNIVKGQFILKVIGPIYFGEFNAICPNAIMIQSYPHVLKEDAPGEYSIRINTPGKYAWFCIPSTMSLSGFALSGFKAPFEEPIEQVLTFGNVSATYKCYRSTESLQAGYVTITVV